jgi:SAM-dependent methyltransferase/uncharacterized protein YbaR (Trm112 family)
MSEVIVCPVTHEPLIEVDLQQLVDTLGNTIYRRAANRASVDNVELPATSLLLSDGRGAYPIVDGVPILMAPEMLTSASAFELIDTDLDPYREAYIEMDFYNSEASKAESGLKGANPLEIVGPISERTGSLGPEWLDATYDVSSQADVYRYISPIEGKRVLQFGGKGVQAVKFLLAGARESWLVTPMLQEAIFARDLANSLAVGDRFHSAVGIGEELPFRSGAFDVVYSGGCIHHTITNRAFPEIQRVLRPGGRFAAWEPSRAPMYALGTKIFGKREMPLAGNREIGVVCRPMDPGTLAPLWDTFQTAKVVYHGTFTRYPLIALGKFGFKPKRKTLERITRIDDKIASKVSLRRFGSGVAMLAESADS